MHEEGSVHNLFVDNDLHHKAYPSHDLPHGNPLRDPQNSLRHLPHGTEGLYEADSLHNLQPGLRNQDGPANQVCPTMRSRVPNTLCSTDRLPTGSRLL